MKIKKLTLAKWGMLAALTLTSVTTYAKFWGSQITGTLGGSTSYDGVHCTQTVIMQDYVCWIAVGAPYPKEVPVPCTPAN